MMKNLAGPMFRVPPTTFTLCVCVCVFIGCFTFAYFGGINGIEREFFFCFV